MWAAMPSDLEISAKFKVGGVGETVGHDLESAESMPPSGVCFDLSILAVRARLDAL